MDRSFKYADCRFPDIAVQGVPYGYPEFRSPDSHYPVRRTDLISVILCKRIFYFIVDSPFFQMDPDQSLLFIPFQLEFCLRRSLYYHIFVIIQLQICLAFFLCSHGIPALYGHLGINRYFFFLS